MRIPILEVQFHVDKTAIDGLRRLSKDYGMRGYKEANSIIGKVLKKINDNTTLHNPSAWVYSSAKAAEESIIVLV